MIKLARRFRLVLSIAILGMGGVVLGNVGPLSADQTDTEEPCELGGSGEWECLPDHQHMYDGNCEGIDCYHYLEECCGG